MIFSVISKDKKRGDSIAYCLYVRKSRADAEAEARGEGETLSRHINILMELANRRHLTVTQIHKEIVSGETIAVRPVMQQLLSEVGQGMWDGVLVMEIERLARGDTVDQGIVAQTFKFSDTKIITPIKNYDPNNEFDEEYFEFGLFMSRREYKTINRRLQRGREASVREGKWVNSRPPYGYEKVKIPNDKGFTLAPKPGEAEIVQMIFELYTKGELQEDGSYKRLGVSLIVRRLNSLKVPPAAAEHWAAATVRDMLHNPVYCGKVRWNWRKDEKKMVDGQIKITRPRKPPDEYLIADGLHPALVSEETFKTAQEFINSNPPRPIGERNTVRNPLAGIVVCAKCGHRMIRRPYPGDYPDTLMCHDTACDNVSSRLEIVEKRVLDALRDWLTKYRIQWETGQKSEEDNIAAELKEIALKRLEGESQTLHKQLDNIHNFLEQGIYTPAQFLDRSGKLSDMIQQNEADREVLRKALQTERDRETSRVQIIPKVERVLEIYDTLKDAKSKNDTLKEVIEKVTYRKEHGGRWHGSPDDFEIVLFPKLPKNE